MMTRMSTVDFASSPDGTQIAYRASGQGEPVVLVHGTGTSGADWLFIRPLLTDRYTVVTMDRRGRGASGDGPEYAMAREAEDILAALDAVDASLLVAHSYGALCSILAAVQTDRLSRLVLYEPPIGVRADGLAGVDELVATGNHDAALEGFLRAAGGPPDQLEAIRSSAAWPMLLGAVPTIPRELRAAADWKHPPGPIHVPLLSLTGGDTTDRVYLDGLEELRAAFPSRRCEELAGQRHFAHVFAPEMFASLVGDFLAE
jgi:pimeloyl-ACP methyl ester carboxylesterase